MNHKVWRLFDIRIYGEVYGFTNERFDRPGRVKKSIVE
jgi:hypothetical protein